SQSRIWGQKTRLPVTENRVDTSSVPAQPRRAYASTLAPRFLRQKPGCHLLCSVPIHAGLMPRRSAPISWAETGCHLFLLPSVGLEIRNPKSEIRNPKIEIRNSKIENAIYHVGLMPRR